jgi:hypothetical protein
MEIGSFDGVESEKGKKEQKLDAELDEILSEVIYIMRERPPAHLPETVEFRYIFNADNGVGHGKRLRSNGWRGSRAGTV